MSVNFNTHVRYHIHVQCTQIDAAQTVCSYAANQTIVKLLRSPKYKRFKVTIISRIDFDLFEFVYLFVIHLSDETFMNLIILN